MKRWLGMAAAVAVLLVAAGCKNGGHAQNSTQLRAINAVPDAEALDVAVATDVKLTGIGFGAVSAYAEFGSGTNSVQFRSSTLTTVLVDKQLALGSGSRNTVVAFGRRATMNEMLLSEDTANPSSGHFKVRVVDLAADAGALDLYVTTTDTNTAPTISNVGFGSVTDYTEGLPGSYKVILTSAGTKDIVFQTTTTTSLADGGILTVMVLPTIGGKLVNVLLLTATSSTLFTNPVARIKAINAVPDSTAINFKADNTVLLSNVPFGGSSSYVTTPSGLHTLQLEASNVPGTNIATLSRQLDAAADYSVIAVNNLSAVGIAVLQDDNSVPAANFARLRFVNALVGSTTVDALVNFASTATAIPYKGQSSSYTTVAPALNYTISFTTPGGVTVIATLTPAEIDAGGVYSAYLTGTTGNAQVRLIRDR